MITENVDVVVIGGGPAGLAAAVSAYDSGAKKVLVLERDYELGGVLNQCIHNGFGLTRFKENLSGPEYAAKFIEEVRARDITVRTLATVIDVKDKMVTYSCPEGIVSVKGNAVIFATGCRERSRGQIGITGTRPGGVFSAGTAQRLVNIYGYKPGKKAVILGSGDIGLIMARRMTLEGVKVECVCELMPYSSGLKRNIEQCLNDFDIPLLLSHTVTEVVGRDRVEGVKIAKVDDRLNPIPDTEKFIECDTLLLSVGLIPENELLINSGIVITGNTKGAEVDQKRETKEEGVFECGNALHVHDLVDFVSEEGEIAGRYAGTHVARNRKFATTKPEGITSYVLPQMIDVGQSEPFKLYFRVKKPVRDGVIEIKRNGEVLKTIRKMGIAPGEMQYVTVDQQFTENDELEVNVYGN